MESQREFGVADLYMAAFLLTRGMRFLRVEREGERRHRFFFQDRPDRPELMRAYVDDGTVRVKDYRHALDDLRALIHNS